MTTEVIVTTQYDTIIVEDENSNTVIVESPSQSYVIVTEGEQGPSGPPGPSTAINTAPDVDVTNLQDGSLLIYSTQSQKWVANTQLNNQSLESGHY